VCRQPGITSTGIGPSRRWSALSWSHPTMTRGNWPPAIIFSRNSAPPCPSRDRSSAAPHGAINAHIQGRDGVRSASGMPSERDLPRTLTGGDTGHVAPRS
jgi:hypothetical protein